MKTHSIYPVVVEDLAIHYQPPLDILNVFSFFMVAMDNALLHASGHYPSSKIEERITFALCHSRLYLSESDDD